MHPNTWLTGSRLPPASAGPAPARTLPGNFPLYLRRLATPWLLSSWPASSKLPGRIPRQPSGTLRPPNVFGVVTGKPKRKKLRCGLAQKSPQPARNLPSALSRRQPRKLLRSQRSTSPVWTRPLQILRTFLRSPKNPPKPLLRNPRRARIRTPAAGVVAAGAIAAGARVTLALPMPHQAALRHRPLLLKRLHRPPLRLPHSSILRAPSILEPYRLCRWKQPPNPALQAPAAAPAILAFLPDCRRSKCSCDGC